MTKLNIIFQISTGIITDDNGLTLSILAYAGNNKRVPQNPNKLQGKNNAFYCDTHNIGPLPPGIYSIGAWGSYNVGQNAAPLTPISCPELYGRGGFYIHGQEEPGNINYGEESEGCCVIPHNDRLKIIALKPTQLTVIL